MSDLTVYILAGILWIGWAISVSHCYRAGKWIMFAGVLVIPWIGFFHGYWVISKKGRW